MVPLNGIEEILDDAGRAKMFCNSKGSGILSQKIERNLRTALRMGARTVASTNLVNLIFMFSSVFSIFHFSARPRNS